MEDEQVSAREAIWCAAATLALLLLLLSSCDYGAPQTYLDTATVRVNVAPSAYQGPYYGKVVASYATELDGQAVSRFVASAGGGSPIVIGRAWDGQDVGERPLQRCKAHECPEGSDVGESLIPFERWGANEAVPKSGCVFAPSNPSEGNARGGVGFVVCETSPVPQHFDLGLDAVRGEGAMLQFSGFGLPLGHPLGVVLFGAHARESRTDVRLRGGLFAQPDLKRVGADPVAPAPIIVPLIDPATGRGFADDPAAGDLGRQVVGTLAAGGVLTVAIAQPSRGRVLVATYHDELSGAPATKLRVRACIDAPSPTLSGFGERLALGDVDADGQPELFVGNDPSSPAGRVQHALFMYRGTGLPAGEAASGRCPSWGAEPVAIACQDADGVACAGADFGAALAAGDVDGDGRAELMIGAPRASVQGIVEAGAVFLYPFGADGPDAARVQVIAPEPREGAKFGSALASLRTRDRDEPVIGAPGSARVYVFLCTPLEPGFGAASQCLPK